MHTHLLSAEHVVSAYGAPEGTPASDAADLINRLDQGNVEKAVVLSTAYQAKSSEGVSAENDWVSEQIAGFPDRLIGFCGINPVVEGAVAEIDRCLSLSGMIGVKLQASGMDWEDDEQVEALSLVLDKSQELDIPVLIHLAGVALDRGGVLNMYRMLGTHSKLRLLLAHCAGLTPGEIENILFGARNAQPRFVRLDNLFLDLSACLEIYQDAPLSQREMIVWNLRRWGLEQVFFGSDYLMVAAVETPEKALDTLTKYPFTQEEIDQIVGNDASAWLFGPRQLAAAVIPDQQPLTDEVLAGFTKYIEEAVERWNIPGAAVAVVADGEVVYAEGFGVRELGKEDPVTADTLFGIGSMTKSINAMMLASLVDDGFFEWDTPAIEIWPDFQLSHPDSTLAVTVRDLLSMQTGMRRDDSLWIGKGLSAEDLMIALAEVPIAGPPGDQHFYDNQGVATAAYLGVMAAGGELSSLFDSYAEQMQERVFDPIGMTSTTLDLESMDSHPEGARPHNWNEAGEPVASSSFFEGFIPGEGIEAAGGVASTANDLARYLITQLNRGVSPDGVRVISSENLTETWAPQINIGGGQDAFLDRLWLPSALYNPLDSQYDYGMGWFVGTYHGIPVVHNPGDLEGWSAHTALLPESDTGIVVLTNSNLLPCGAYMKIAVQHRLMELRYGLDNTIDGYIDQIGDTVRDAFGVEC